MEINKKTRNVKTYTVKLYLFQFFHTEITINAILLMSALTDINEMAITVIIISIMANHKFRIASDYVTWAAHKFYVFFIILQLFTSRD